MPTKSETLVTYSQSEAISTLCVMADSPAKAQANLMNFLAWVSTTQKTSNTALVRQNVHSNMKTGWGEDGMKIAQNCEMQSAMLLLARKLFKL